MYPSGSSARATSTGISATSSSTASITKPSIITTYTTVTTWTAGIRGITASFTDDNRKDQYYYYVDLRARANKEGDEMARCFSERHEAYSRGDRAAAKNLSKQGKNHKQKMEQLNKEASKWVYHQKNRDSKPGEIDLHGLYVKEAIAYTDAALEEAKLRGDSEIRLIVGKGLHCESGEAKLGPAISGLMRKYQLPAEFDPLNSGVLVVGLNGDTPIRHRQHLNISHRRSRRHRRRAGNIGA
ncbi:hypothetical protein EDD85DRAFT_996096 [Armillaria nabsnona]|nr:hypothetical protein EDD85DRAFT_996096 [Armillaria nabsnona]